MTVFQNILSRIVAAFAIRSWRDLVLKLVLFFIVVNLIAIQLDFVSLSTFSVPMWVDDFWVVMLVAVPVLIVQLGIVTYLNRLQKRLSVSRRADALTGLPDRRAFIAQASASRTLHPVGHMLLLDADNFRRINDAYGNEIGDDCLRTVAEAIRAQTTERDVFGRMGGEEFAVYLPIETETDIKTFAEKMTKKITHKLGKTHADGRSEITVTLSIGIVDAGPHHSIDMLLGRADDALYCAKDAGRARMVRWEDMPSALRKAS
jgi:diguanylate cyclase (GGDEF)-like protein